jgi:thiol-disulfide isomerase/thioredoxin
LKFLLTILFLSVIQLTSFSQSFTITAALTGFPDGTTFYVDEVHTQQTIATGKIRHDQLTITGNLAEAPSMLVLKATINNYVYACFVLMGNEKVNVKGDIKDFPFYIKVSGSKYQDENEILKKQTRYYDKQRDSISQNLFELINDTSIIGQEKLMRVARQQAYYDRIMDSITLEFIRENLRNHAAVNQLYYLRKKFSKDSVEILYNSLSDPLKESIFGRKLFTYLKVGNVLKVGDAASNFAAQDVQGKQHQISESKSKWVLLEFTETYCVPCVKAVDELKVISKKYADKLTVISFCADKQKEIWLKGKDRDQPGWLCLWDGKGPASETPLKYGVNSYPTFILINPEGKIESRFSGYATSDITSAISKFIVTQAN